jgi:integrase
MKLQKIVHNYTLSYDYKKLRDETKVQYKYFMNIMLNTEVEGKPLCHYNIDNITIRMAKTAYNEWCERGIHLANHAISVTRIIFNYGLSEELCRANPFANVRKRAAERRKVVWGRGDVQKFLDVAYSDFSTRNIGLIAQMAYEWCQRVGDMRLLTWDSLNLSDQIAHIKQSKRKAEVFLPISDELHEMLVQQHKDFGFQPYVAPRPRPIAGEYKPYTLHKLPLYARDVMDAAKLPKELRLSDLRRTGTTEMVDAGVGMAQIMSVTGHSNPQSVQPYLKNTLISADRALTDRKIHGKSITSAAKESDYT